MSYNLERYNLNELKQKAEKMGLKPRRSKSEMIKDITDAFKEYEKYKRDKIDRYKKIEKIGEGKEGTTYLVKDRKGRELAMKTFRKGKSSSNMSREIEFQKKASKKGISPRIYNHDTVSKYIVMEKMDCHLYEVLNRQKGILTRSQQHRIIEIFNRLDDIGVFHNDANLCNYMVKDKQIYIIDFGFAKEITPRLVKKMGTENPNSKIMLLGFILKLKDKNVPEKSWKYLKKHLSKESVEKFNL